MARCQRIAHTGSDHGVEPVDRAGAGNRSGAGDLEVADLNRARHAEGQIPFLIPVARAGEDVEGERAWRATS